MVNSDIHERSKGHAIFSSAKEQKHSSTTVVVLYLDTELMKYVEVSFWSLGASITLQIEIAVNINLVSKYLAWALRNWL